MDPASVPLALFSRAVSVLLLVALALPVAPLYALGRVALPRPPVVPSLRRTIQVGRWILTERPPAPGLRLAGRAALLLRLVGRTAMVPWQGLAWWLDEALDRRALDRTPVTAPVFELSAARSGSTQLARYLEDTPGVVAPSVLQTLFPYRWLWRVARATLAGRVDLDRVRARFASSLPAAFVERHELDPLRTDTFEMMFLQLHHGTILWALGPRVLREEMAPSRVGPHAGELWERDFVTFVDRLGRKLLLDAGPGHRLFVKGHFLAAAPGLDARFPDARFLAVLRPPVRRIHSVVNFHHCQPYEPVCGPTPWPWVTELALDAEVDYCTKEREWFDGHPRRYVVRFEDFVADLPGTLRAVSVALFDRAPDHAPAVHPHRKRAGYSVDRSLAELGVDEAALAARLDGYVAWMKRAG